MTARRVRVIVDGKPYVVEFEDVSASPLAVRVNGQPFTVEVVGDETIVAPSRGDRSATPAPEPKQAFAPSPAGPPVAPSPGQVATRPIPPVGNTVVAPMPGLILDIFVAAGDTIHTKQDLCILEAMKMKNVIRAPRAGTIAEVRVRSNQAVGKGEVLFVLATPS